MPRWRARSEKREYEPTHARAVQRRLGMAIIACLAILVIAGGIIYIMLRYPNGFIHKAAPSASPAAAATCDYYYQDVTVMLTGVSGSGLNGSGCATVIQPMVNHIGGVWRSQTITAAGEEFARLGSGAMVVRVYDRGDSDRPLAGRVADYFQNAGWRPLPPG